MQVLPTTYAYVFPPDTPEDLIADMNDAIVELKETGVFAALKSQYIDPPTQALWPQRSGLRTTSVPMRTSIGL